MQTPGELVGYSVSPEHCWFRGGCSAQSERGQMKWII